MTTITNVPHLPRISNADETPVQRFVELAVRGLVPMFDRTAQLFYFRLNEIGSRLIPEGHSPRYTAITLLGLHRFEENGGHSPIKIAPALAGLLGKTDWVNNIGDLGLLIWLCARAAPDRLEEFGERLDIDGALHRYGDAEQGSTMELAWFLTGLSYWRLLCSRKGTGLNQLAREVYARLKANQGKRGLFAHCARSRNLAARTRGWIGTFADQVYPIYAMSLFSSVYGDREAETRSLDCARAICEAQGRKGQWWWHYDSSRGRVIDGYPVFSVHQHGMAPMALLMLADVTGHDFNPWIYRGLQWINSNNELSFEMESSRCGVIWRCIYRAHRSPVRYVKASFGSYAGKIEHGHPQDLRVLFECRPYELGWLLYAFSGRCSDHRLTPAGQP